MAKILSIIESAYRGTIEEQDDTIVWLNQLFKKGGADVTVLLRSNAVNYAVKGQNAEGFKFGNFEQQNAPEIATDIAKLIEQGAEVYALTEDLQDRGIEQELVSGVQLVSKTETVGLIEKADHIWHW